jgi:hypothetical protein
MDAISRHRSLHYPNDESRRYEMRKHNAIWHAIVAIARGATTSTQLLATPMTGRAREYLQVVLSTNHHPVWCSG